MLHHQVEIFRYTSVLRLMGKLLNIAEHILRGWEGHVAVAKTDPEWSSKSQAQPSVSKQTASPQPSPETPTLGRDQWVCLVGIRISVQSYDLTPVDCNALTYRVSVLGRDASLLNSPLQYHGWEWLSFSECQKDRSNAACRSTSLSVSPELSYMHCIS